jgi:two-component system, OmpR family, response regulator CpxR
MTAAPVLVIDDDVELCCALTRLLAKDGFNVTAVHDAESGIVQALNRSYSLVILDVMLPGGDGRKVLRRIRVASQVPVIMLTARGNEADRTAGLQGGADDYLPKPFNTRELVARMYAILRRQTESVPAMVYRVGDLEIQHNTRRVLRCGEPPGLDGASGDGQNNFPEFVFGKGAMRLRANISRCCKRKAEAR